MGGFDINQMTIGLIAWFNIWDSEMTDVQVKSLTYRDTGNVVNWGTLKVQGEDRMYIGLFPTTG